MNPSAPSLRGGFRRPSLFTFGVLLAVGAVVSASASLILDQRDLWQRHAAVEADGIPWVVFLKDGADRAPVEDALRVLPGVRSMRFISKDEALESVKADPAFADGLSLTGNNPFPDSFTVAWEPMFIRTDLLDQHAKRLSELPAVDHVDYDRSRAERFSLMQKALSQLDLAVETLKAASAALLLALAGRLLFFVPEPPSAGLLAGGVAAAAAGAATGCLAARVSGAPADIPVFLAGAAAAGVLALGLEALRT